MSVEFDRESPGKFDSRTLNRTTINRWTGRKTRSLDRAPLSIIAMTYYYYYYYYYYYNYYYYTTTTNNILIIIIMMTKRNHDKQYTN